MFPRAALADLEDDLLGRVECADKNSEEELEELLGECVRRVAPTSHIVLSLKRHLGCH